MSAEFDYQAWLAGRRRLELDLPGYRKAAVLVALTREPLPRVLLTVRSSDLPTHAGQISFPGGRLEAGETAVTAALREAWEEVGLEREMVEVLGLLDDTFTPSGSATGAGRVRPDRIGFQVTPVLALIPPGARLTLSSEVVELLMPTLEDLRALRIEALERTAPDGRRHRIYRFPWRDQGRVHDIWGMTARVLYGLLHPELGALDY